MGNGGRQLTVVIADGNSVFRSGVVALLARETDVRAVPATSTEMLLGLLAELTPAVVLVDVDLPPRGGIDAIARIKRRAPGVQTVAIAATPDRELVLAIVRAGARGIIERSVHSGSLARIVRRAASGEVTLPRHLLGHVLDEFASIERRIDASAALSPLSARERQVLALIGEGRRNREIARDPLDLGADGEASRAQHAREAPCSHPSGGCEPRRRGSATAPCGGRVARGCELAPQPHEKAHARVATSYGGHRARSTAGQRRRGYAPAAPGAGRRDAHHSRADGRRAHSQRAGGHRLLHREPRRGTLRRARRADRRRRLGRRTPRVVAERGSGRRSKSRSSTVSRVSGTAGSAVPSSQGSQPPELLGSASWMPTSSTRRQRSRRCVSRPRSGEERSRGRLALPRRWLDRRAECRAHVHLAPLVRLARLAFPFAPARRHRPAHRASSSCGAVALDLAILRPHGFKILLEILVRSPKLAVSEIPFRLRRTAGRREQGLRTGGRSLSRAGLAAPPRHAARALRPLRPRRVERHRRQLARARGIPRRVGLQRARWRRCSRPSARRSGTSSSSNASSSTAPPPAGSLAARARRSSS